MPEPATCALLRTKQHGDQNLEHGAWFLNPLSLLNAARMDMRIRPSDRVCVAFVGTHP